MATKTKVVTYTIKNTKDHKAKLSNAIADINRRQNSTGTTLFNIICTIAGLFNAVVGIGAASFSMGGLAAANKLEFLEDFYTEIYRELTHPYTGPNIESITVTQIFYGSYQGKNKGTVYSAGNPTYKAKYR